MSSEIADHLSVRWEPPEKEYYVTPALYEQGKRPDPLVMMGLLAAKRAHDYNDKSERILCNFKNTRVDTFDETTGDFTPDGRGRRSIENDFTFAGTMLTGESASDKYSQNLVTLKYNGLVQFRNTGKSRREANQQLYAGVSHDPDWCEERTKAATLPDLKTAEILVTVHQKKFKSILDRKVARYRTRANNVFMKNSYDAGRERWFRKTYAARHFIGMCMLGCDTGKIGSVLLR